MNLYICTDGQLISLVISVFFSACATSSLQPVNLLLKLTVRRELQLFCICAFSIKHSTNEFLFMVFVFHFYLKFDICTTRPNVSQNGSSIEHDSVKDRPDFIKQNFYTTQLFNDHLQQNGFFPQTIKRWTRS